MRRLVCISILLFPVLTLFAVAQPSVHVDPDIPVVPRPLEPQTKRAAIRDYLQSWQTMQSAFAQNRADLLGGQFVGIAKDKLSGAIKEQSALGLQTRYQDVSHNIQFLFYSSEGLSIEFTDLVTFNLQVFDHGRLVDTRQESTRYLVVMSPAETSWKVRIFQAMSS